jgi:two-component system OmpR family sensor kinase
MRPPSLGARIVAAFVILALAAWLAIGATMFVILRGLDATATTSALADISQTFLVRFSNNVAQRDLQAIVAEIRSGVAGSGTTIHVLRANGRLADLGDNGGGGPEPADAIVIPAESTRGQTISGSVPYTDGKRHLYAATVLRNPNAAGLGPRAIILSRVDQSGAEALQDVLRSLPIVILVTLIVGGPLAVVLSRSVAGPLRRLVSAASNLPLTAGEPLPLEGPPEVRELTDRFNAMAAELAVTRASESELLANLRHDLRTPLTVISGFAAALSDGTATGEAAARAASAIEEEAGRLEALVEELGAIERLRMGTDGIHPQPTDAGALLQAARDRFESTASAQGVTLVVDEPTDGWPTFAADKLALDRILANLIGNAMAVVSSGGEIRLAARALSGYPGLAGPAVALTVSDDGPGFPPGGSGRAFERFYRGDSARTGQGSGLGLAIVMELARAHGGTATAENLSPRGARVSVVLPLVPGAGS